MIRHCIVPGCEEPVLTAGFCEAHYHRNRRTGSPEGATGRVCGAPGCGKPHYGRGLCDLHFSQAEGRASGEGKRRGMRDYAVVG